MAHRTNYYQKEIQLHVRGRIGFWELLMAGNLVIRLG